MPNGLTRMAEPVIAVVGPTAAGKSELALRLALEIGGEIINADSMQLYAGMDIGTAKLPVAERRGVPHHLLDIWDVKQTASVAEYQRLARDAIADIQRRGLVPVLAGAARGTRMQGQLLCMAAPYGVTYLVASWEQCRTD